MSEFESKHAASTDLQLDLLIAEVESKFIDAEDALSELRHAVRRLKSYRPPVASAEPRPAAAAEAHEWAARDAEPAPSTHGPDEAAREEVSRIVAETRAETQVSRLKLDEETVGVPFWPGPKKAEPAEDKFQFVENYGMDSTSEASWPVTKPGNPLAEPAWAAAEPVDTAPATHDPVEADASDDDDEARREEVARIVAQMRDGRDDEDEASAEQDTSEEDDDESRRHDVARMVAQLHDSVDVEAEPSENGSAPSHGDDEARRDEVARMVAELRNGELETEAASDGAEEADVEAPEAEIAEVVAETQAEIEVEGPSDEEEPAAADDESDEQVRDEVRRAVEAARAELATGYTDSEENLAAGEKRFSFPDWQTTHMEPSGPPVIVIKDSEGRVELARVYETLSRVNCDENAALLNYTPHSVTVGLNAKASVPEVEALTDAVRSVFGRACEVDSDGVRVNVQIGKDLKGKDSAA